MVHGAVTISKFMMNFSGSVRINFLSMFFSFVDKNLDILHVIRLILYIYVSICDCVYCEIPINSAVR